MNTTLNFNQVGRLDDGVLWRERLWNIEEVTQAASIYPEGQDEVVIPFAFDVQLNVRYFKDESEHKLIETLVELGAPIETLTTRFTFSIERDISVNATPDIGSGSGGSSQDFEGATQELQPLWTETISEMVSRHG